ncbi:MULTISPECIES: DUF1801 domain-containing protein [Acidovorax]|uniref:DUF1801 domain-containing protein n=1 Tax=Acidovorax facilis TaxID=12917 RepID=A0ABV8DF04_9BURK|nr:MULTISPECIES: DUF1801 domain-containing protein [Acidovorax]KQB59892.1 hypothetical protein AE621_07895 [Acidovorax sp. SD340]MBO1006875.1 DUF1801 domain-containing protein [Acidovorax sp. SD340]MCO4240381.1 DUF1801 domain-containing protein [Acidovorax facilis]
MTEDRVNQLLQDIQQRHPEQHSVLQGARALVLALGPDVREEVKYGGILFSAPQPFCGLFAYTRHVSLEFGDGAQLPDAFKVLEGAGKQRRHIKLHTAEDLAAKQVAHYLGLACSLSNSPKRQ